MNANQTSVDYADAAGRHRKDGDLLYQKQRWPNADQLYGLAAECALKAIMRGLGMALRPDGAPREDRHRVHVDRLWNEFSSFANDNGGARYASELPPNNPFSNWSIDQRYHRSSTIPRSVVDAHQEAVRKVFIALDRARVDGRL